LPSEYRLKRRVHFYEVDLAGIVHFSWYFRYMEEAEHALWREAGLSIARFGEETGYPRVNASCDFHGPLHFEDEFEVLVRVAAVSRRSMRYTFLISRDGRKIATGATTIACVRKKPGEPLQAVDIPAEVASRFSVALGDDASN
jgi:YbgC/YbaW family acyl-CoA thioester hydrolase